MKAVAYCRKSTSGIDENGVERQEGSFDRQKTAIEDYAKKNGIQIVSWYVEPVSGKSTRKRKIFKQMITDAEAGQFTAILFGEYDRFMRNVLEAWRYEVKLRDAGVKMHFSNLRNDGSDSEEIYKDMFRRMAANYSRVLAERTLQGMVRKAKMGSWVGGTPPYGYNSSRNGDGKVSLVVKDEEAEIVREMFKRSLDGWGHKRIAEWLNGQGVPAYTLARGRAGGMRNPDGKWGATTVRAMLMNPVYKGVFRWNKKSRVDCFEWSLEGRGTVEIGELRSDLKEFKRGSGFYIDRTKPEEKWITKDGAVPVIIPREVFDEVQRRFKRYECSGKRRGNNFRYLMSGALRCCTCGNGFFGHRYSKILDSTNKRAYYEYYRCSGDVQKGSHKNTPSKRPMLKRGAVDEVVVRGILKRIQGLSDISRVKLLLKNRIERFLDDRPDRLAKVEKEIVKTEAEIQRAIEAYQQFGREMPTEKRRELTEKIEFLKADRQELLSAGETNLQFDVEKEAEECVAKIAEAKTILEADDPHDKIRIRDRFLKSAEVDFSDCREPKIRIYWWKESSLLVSSNSAASTNFVNRQGKF